MKILRDSIFNIVGFGAPLLLSIYVIPILIDSLGLNTFGKLTVVWAVVSYFGIFDFGIARALTLQLVGNDCSHRSISSNTVISTSITILLCIGLTLSAVLIALALFAHRRFPGFSHVDYQCVCLVAFTLPAIVVSNGLRGVLEAKNKFFWINSVRLPLGLLIFLIPLLVVSINGPDLVIIVGLLCLSRYLALVYYFPMASRLYPGTRYFRNLDFIAARQLICSGGWMMVSNIVSPLIGFADRFVVASRISTEAAAYYSTTQDIATRAWFLPGALLGVIFPHFVELARTRTEFAVAAYRSCITIVFFLVFPPLAFAAMFSHDVLSLWISESFAESGSFVLSIFCVGVALNCAAQVSFTLIQSFDRPKITATAHLIELPVYIFSLLAVMQFGEFRLIALVWLLRITADAFVMFYWAERLLSSQTASGRRVVMPILIHLIPVIPISFLSFGIMKILCAVVLILISLVKLKQEINDFRARSLLGNRSTLNGSNI